MRAALQRPGAMDGKPLAAWGVNDVTTWLEGLGLGQLAPAFKHK